MYSIIRFHFNGDKLTLTTGLTLEEAKEHCRDKETSSRTCEYEENVRYTKEHGSWFDGYTEE